VLSFIRNLLALIGLLTLATIVVLVARYEPWVQSFLAFDRQAASTYAEMARVLAETGNGAEATIWKRRVADGLAAEDVEEVMRFVANEHNIKNVGELPLYKEVEAVSGEPFRHLKIFMFCNAMTAARMVNYSDAFSAYLPCRITLVEDQQGQLWLYTLNMDLMIHGGRPLPPELKEEAEDVKRIILDIMDRAANGEF
jgi:hypothetical protein